jgi:ribosome-associated protein
VVQTACDSDYVVSVFITPALSIPENELVYRATRSGGPGGQHVNTSSTRIELWWDPAGSPSLTEEQRAHLLARLRARLDSSGRLRLVSSGSRSQLQNRKEVTERLRHLVAQGLVVPKKRKKTKPSRAAVERRLDDKKKRGTRKQLRKKPVND